jgi:hypothetical protein
MFLNSNVRITKSDANLSQRRVRPERGQLTCSFVAMVGCTCALISRSRVGACLRLCA